VCVDPRKTNPPSFSPPSGRTIKFSRCLKETSSTGLQPGLPGNQRQAIVPRNEDFRSREVAIVSKVASSFDVLAHGHVSDFRWVRRCARRNRIRSRDTVSSESRNAAEFVWRLQRRKNPFGGKGSDLRVLLHNGSRRQSRGRKAADSSRVGTLSQHDRRRPGAIDWCKWTHVSRD